MSVIKEMALGAFDLKDAQAEAYRRFHKEDAPGKAQLIAQKRNLCNVRAEFDKDIAKMQAHRAAIDAGIQALEAQINGVIDKPQEKA